MRKSLLIRHNATMLGACRTLGPMHGLGVYKKSGRAFVMGGQEFMRRSVSLCIHGLEKGHFHVRVCGIHVVDVV